MLGALLAASLAVAALSALTGCGDDEPDVWSQPIRPPGPVLLVGDSIFFQSASELVSALKDDGWEVVFDARPGASILAGAEVAPVDWPSRIRDLARVARPAIAVVELGTNGCGCRLGDDPEDAVEDAIGRILDSLDGVPVFWVAVRNSTESSEDPDLIPAVIEEVAADEEQVRLLPYDEWFDARPELLDPDGVHLLPNGEHYLAEQVVAAIREVSRPRADR